MTLSFFTGSCEITCAFVTRRPGRIRKPVPNAFSPRTRATEPSVFATTSSVVSSRLGSFRGFVLSATVMTGVIGAVRGCSTGGAGAGGATVATAIGGAGAGSVGGFSDFLSVGSFLAIAAASRFASGVVSDFFLLSDFAMSALGADFLTFGFAEVLGGALAIIASAGTSAGASPYISYQPKAAPRTIRGTSNRAFLYVMSHAPSGIQGGRRIIAALRSTLGRGF